jgi:hypothetical protein
MICIIFHYKSNIYLIELPQSYGQEMIPRKFLIHKCKL